jgi:cytidylate kinase
MLRNVSGSHRHVMEGRIHSEIIMNESSSKISLHSTHEHREQKESKKERKERNKKERTLHSMSEMLCRPNFLTSVSHP